MMFKKKNRQEMDAEMRIIIDQILPVQARRYDGESFYAIAINEKELTKFDKKTLVACLHFYRAEYGRAMVAMTKWKRFFDSLENN